MFNKEFTGQETRVRTLVYYTKTLDIIKKNRKPKSYISS